MVVVESEVFLDTTILTAYAISMANVHREDCTNIEDQMIQLFLG